MDRKNIGIALEPPPKACRDVNCAWHGELPVRGRIFRGTVRSSKPKDSVIVEWGYVQRIPKYDRYERRKSRVVAHNPECMKAREGDSVIIAECRPLSKTKRFVVVGVPERRTEKPEFRVAEIEAAAVASQDKKARAAKAAKKASKE
jgi:small subunit ribosomal protein S17